MLLLLLLFFMVLLLLLLFLYFLLFLLHPFNTCCCMFHRCPVSTHLLQRLSLWPLPPPPPNPPCPFSRPLSFRTALLQPLGPRSSAPAQHRGRPIRAQRLAPHLCSHWPKLQPLFSHWPKPQRQPRRPNLLSPSLHLSPQNQLPSMPPNQCPQALMPLPLLLQPLLPLQLSPLP